MVRSPVVEAIGYRPGTGGRIVEFGTVKFGGVSPGHEHHAVRQESGGVVVARGVEAASS